MSDKASASRAADWMPPRTAATAAALTVTLGLAAGCWIISVGQMRGMDMGVATRLGTFPFFAALWVPMMAAMMLPGAIPAVVRRAQASEGVRALPPSLSRISPSGPSSASRCTSCTGRMARSSPGSW